jgi:hypothetical protein
MQVWLEMACPECEETRALDGEDFPKLSAKYPLVCSTGHKYKRADGFIHWLVQLSPFGSALLFCNALIEGEIIYDGSEDYDVKLPVSLQGSEIWARPTNAWRAARGDVDFAYTYDRVAYVRLRVPRRSPTKGVVAAQYQIVGARGLSRTPGWRQVMGEALSAYEEARTNVSVLLSNIAFETFYSAVADPKLRRKGMPQDIINDLHQKLPLETRLREGFARSLRLPALASAPFWREWVNKARRPRHGLAHQWLYDRDHGRRHASSREAYDALALHLRAIHYLEPRAFDWLARLRTTKAAPVGDAEEIAPNSGGSQVTLAPTGRLR